ncbi:ABC transporter permease [Paenibacillus sp. SN-8-1]|uniref:ABC transporter permease n=1 Tax=Paenibacillus sp. SN-8-1 TaxID=3435409 RepID=UPI003D9A3BC5
MRNLLLSEMERLWKRKLTWVFFLAIPLIIFATAKYYMSTNLLTPVNSPEHVSSQNFPVMALIEQLIVVFNIISLIMLTLSFTEEYRSGQLRMVMLRAFTFGQLFTAKYLAYVITIVLYFVAYLGNAVVMGQLFFGSEPSVRLFYHETSASGAELLIYSLQYYGTALLTTLAMGSVFTFIAVICSTSTASIGVGKGFLLLSMGYPTIYSVANKVLKLQLPDQLELLSITQIQYKGVALMLSDNKVHYPAIVLGTLEGYIAMGLLGAFIGFTKRDRWI